MGLRCLIVDDNERFLSVASSSLRRGGIDVIGTALTIADALRLAAELRPDAALVDIALGDESGFDLARQLADGTRGLHVPVVLISTRDEDDFADLIAESPAVGFLSKSDLSAHAVRAMLSAQEA